MRALLILMSVWLLAISVWLSLHRPPTFTPHQITSRNGDIMLVGQDSYPLITGQDDQLFVDWVDGQLLFVARNRQGAAFYQAPLWSKRITPIGEHYRRGGYLEFIVRDGDWVVYYADSTLWRLHLPSETVEQIANAKGVMLPLGRTDKAIIFSDELTSGLIDYYQVNFDGSRFERLYRLPSYTPNPDLQASTPLPDPTQPWRLWIGLAGSVILLGLAGRLARLVRKYVAVLPNRVR